MRRSLILRLLMGASASLGLAWPVAAQAPELAMLGTLERGSWDFRSRNGGSLQKVCVRSGMEIIQLRHRQRGCERFVVQDEPDEVTIHYTCRGDGYGRTTIRREGNGLVQIRSEGIQDGSPFTLQGEARYTGRC